MVHENLFKIYIPEPCHEDWGKMTPNEQGAYCRVCTKTVVDFSERTDEDVQKFLLDNAENKICGRFRVSQIENDETPKLKIEKPKWEFPGFLIPVLTQFRATALALMLCASAMLSSCGSEVYGSGDDDRKLAGTVVMVDSTEKPINDTRIQGGIKPVRVEEDSTCNTVDEQITVGKIRIEQVVDTVKSDSTEVMIKGEIEPVRKMHGVIKRKD